MTEGSELDRPHDTPSTGGPAPRDARRCVAAIIPAKDEADRIGATIAAVHGIDGVDLVVVVDDGSSDDTADVAAAAGAVVVRHDENRGKAAAVATGARRVAQEEVSENSGRPPRALLLVDADLGGSAASLGVLVPPVLLGEVDLTIATLPPQARGGGRGRVVRFARRAITHLTGFRPAQPLSGQRCISRQAFEAAQPLASGWGIEVGMTVDVLRAGYRVREVPCDLEHRVTGADWSGRAHRARQGVDAARALARRELPRLPKDAEKAVTTAARWAWAQRPGRHAPERR